jgi:hypothetical protein
LLYCPRFNRFDVKLRGAPLARPGSRLPRSFETAR